MTKCAITKIVMAHDGATGLRRHDLVPIVKTEGAFSAPSRFPHGAPRRAQMAQISPLNRATQKRSTPWFDKLREVPGER